MMKKIMQNMMMTITMLFAALGFSSVAMAQDGEKIAVINIDRSIKETAAYLTSQEQRQVTYKAQIDQAEVETRALNARLLPMYDQWRADSVKPDRDQAEIDRRLAEMQQIELTEKQKIQQTLQPVALSEAYVLEQLTERFTAVLDTVVQSKNLTLVITQGSVLWRDDAIDITEDVIAEYNRIIPNAVLTPPPGWLPQAQREAAARTAAVREATAQDLQEGQGR